MNQTIQRDEGFEKIAFPLLFVLIGVLAVAWAGAQLAAFAAHRHWLSASMQDAGNALLQLRNNLGDPKLAWAPEFAAQHPALTAIRFRIDRTYHALLLAEHLGKDSVVTKTFRLIGLKRAGDRYTMKAVEIRDEATRRKTRLTVGEAQIGVPWPVTMFSPDQLATKPGKP